MYLVGFLRLTARYFLIGTVVLPYCWGGLWRAQRLNVEVEFSNLDDVMLFYDIGLVVLQIIRA